MAKIVFFCIPAHGHTNPTRNVVRALADRGHQVWYYSTPDFQAVMEEAGAVFVPLEGFQPRQSPEDAVRLGRDLAFSTKLLVDATLALDANLTADMTRLRPDCIVADSMALWGKAVAGKLGIPFVSSTTTFAFNRESSKIIPRSRGELFSLLLALPRANRQVRRLRRRGYPFRSALDILDGGPHTPTIVYTSPEFQPCAESFSSSYAFVGPSIRPAVETVQKNRDTLVYISMGTVHNDLLPLYRRCVEALGGSRHQVILSVGSAASLAALGPLPENVEAHARVDQIAVLQKADLFLSHCGMNSASESLYFSVPLLMLPQTPEQRGVAERIRQLGAGRALEHTDPPSIRAGVEEVLGNPHYRKAAGGIAESFRRCPGAAGAADLILEVCRKRP